VVEQSTLLQIIQFVGLITPALAILIELLIRFHRGLSELQDNKQLPLEIQILFLGFSAILLGGMGVGIQMIVTLNQSVTQFAALLIFGGLPLLAISILVVNVRISVVSDPSENIFQGFLSSLHRVSSVGLPLSLTIVLYFGPIDFFRQGINKYISWWIFHSDVQPIWYFYIVFAILLYKTMYSLWAHGSIPTDDLSGMIGDWFVVSFTVGAFFSVLSLPVFLIYHLLLSVSIPFVTTTSPLSSAPYIWGIFLVFALLYNEIDPDQN